MGELTLVIGNKNYSSWSLRAWLLLKQAGIAFQEIKIPLHTEAGNQTADQYSPSGKVPVLIDGDVKVWESLAILEYIAERHPEKKLWPENAEVRSYARAISSEMHAGFTNLRKNMVMNCRTSLPGKGMAEGVQADISRITQIWNECRKRFGRHGRFLFGFFTAADAMYAPVAFRFNTYGVSLDPVSKQYMEAMLNLPAMQDWLAAARIEPEAIPEYEK